MDPASWRVDALLTGTVAPLADDLSAIAKRPVDAPRRVGRLGIEGDEQADLGVHGGPDKAIHHYPRDHYGWWRETLGDRAAFAAPGAFGENVSTSGLTEEIACIGDRYRLGTALVEIAQGRQPCWKQAAHLAAPAVVAAMVKTARSGWYYRVIEDGVVAPGDALTLVDRPHAEWTVARVTLALIAGQGRDPATLPALAELAVLAEGWRTRAARLER